MRRTEEYSISLSSENEAVEKKKEKKQKLSLFEVFEAGVAAVVVVTLLFLFCFRVFSVDGPSMKPTLQPDDRVVVSTVGYKAKVGDVVKFAFDLNKLHIFDKETEQVISN